MTYTYHVLILITSEASARRGGNAPFRPLRVDLLPLESQSPFSFCSGGIVVWTQGQSLTGHCDFNELHGRWLDSCFELVSSK